MTWCLPMMFLNLAYNSNIRASLLSPVLEPKLDSLDDVIKRGATLHMGGFLDPGDSGRIHTAFHKRFVDKLGDYAARSGGVYAFPQDFSVPDYVIEDIVENGAALVNSERMMNSNARINPTMYSQLRVSKE